MVGVYILVCVCSCIWALLCCCIDASVPVFVVVYVACSHASLCSFQGVGACCGGYLVMGRPFTLCKVGNFTLQKGLN